MRPLDSSYTPDSGRDVFPLLWIYRNVFALQNGATAENPLTPRRQVDTLHFSLKLLTSEAVKKYNLPKTIGSIPE